MIELKYKALVLPLLTCSLLWGCGNDGKDGEPGTPATVGMSLNQASSIKAKITQVSIDAGTVMVDFDFTNANGVAITDLDTYPGVDTLGMGIAKLVPQEGEGYKTPQWVNYMNNLVAPNSAAIPSGYQDKAGPKVQPTIETSCRQECLTQPEPGHYRYTFRQNLASVTAIEGLDLSYAPSLVHRVSMELRLDSDRARLINTHYDFVPATGLEASEEMTRTVENTQDSCLRCHGDNYALSSAPSLILHGGRRIDTANCQMCHTSYAADPETGAPLDLGYMVHKIHKADYLMVGYGGRLQDFSEVTFPADLYDCRVCHQEGEGRPVDAANFRHHRALACGSCHSDSTDPETIKEEMHASYQAEHECVVCHSEKDDEGAGHHVTDAIAKENVRLDYKAALVANSARLEGGRLSFSVSFMDSKGVAQPSPNADTRLKYSTLYLGFGNDVDFTKGRASINLLTLTPVAGADGIYSYDVASSLKPDDVSAASASAFITTQMCVDRDTLIGVACGTGTDEAFNPSVIPGKAVVFNLSGDTGVSPRRSVISNESCAQCHDNQYLAKFSSKMHHSGRRSNFEGECQTCHNPAWASSANGLIQDHIDFKVLIHARHGQTAVVRAEDITFPEYIGNCGSCHKAGQLTLAGLNKVPATPAVDELGNEVEYSPTAATCVSCHGPKESLLSHIRTNGGKANDPRDTYKAGDETCAVCHGEGQAFGVDKVHPIRFD
ncbi:OmcA/MtrC family decaheme c-type cytochrome [Shewanella cyperi]|uniref:OmcA/MtrC family decaheme c-type cytochrome n=1 Tax=Shewanella cyperi TaxID=2814292 RepID=A0A975ALW1_9GAMM|nr:OmcA/MtrC family decaheme c-type cytochrome [Shewanella cyperi]QSX31216.1 OmcA/MtrC family decaheme c-type cytochrome [Shewanella cyperi]